MSKMIKIVLVTGATSFIGFLNGLKCSRHNKVKKVILASSSSLYGGNEKVPFSEEDNVDKSSRRVIDEITFN